MSTITTNVQAGPDLEATVSFGFDAFGNLTERLVESGAGTVAIPEPIQPEPIQPTPIQPTPYPGPSPIRMPMSFAASEAGAGSGGFASRLTEYTYDSQGEFRTSVTDALGRVRSIATGALSLTVTEGMGWLRLGVSG